ncbi:MAG: ATP-NAD kinase family protein [Synergistaceae bacterium]|nr:ATP-NAD kinase family protein [Synergistaceae bacterium]
MTEGRSRDRKVLGLIVNPVAGMGGAVGLKGTDGRAVLERALSMGALPRSPLRVREALEALKRIADDIRILTCSGDMGALESERAGLPTEVLPIGAGPFTSAVDTMEAARKMEASGVDMILFAGGDGTARDIAGVVGTRVPSLGIPSGVKIHSPVFGRNPAMAGELAGLFMSGAKVALEEREVMDIDEEAFRKGTLRASLFGYLLVPSERRFLQGGKAGGGKSVAVELDGIAQEIISRMMPGDLYLVGPGTTTAAVMRRMGCEYSLLGVDAVRDRKTLGTDLPGKYILDLAEPGRTWLILSVIGGQGFILGRGNLQVTPEVIRVVGKERILVAGTPEKLKGLFGKALFVDTGDPLLDLELCGYTRVVTGLGEETLFRVER